jgi:metal-responsive CopG/Arc/MetJ family transcriptional regulator
MKIAVSIDAALLRQADDTARLMGLSRSRLFANAVSDFLRRQREEQMLARLNEAYSTGVTDSWKKAVLGGIRSKVRRTVKDVKERL